MRPSGYVSAGQVQQIAYTPYGNASGGSSSTITVSGQSYTLLSFTSDGTLTVNRGGLFDVLMFGGGGAGGSNQNVAEAQGGGGGGGGKRQVTLYLAAGTYAVTIGAGAAGGIGNDAVANPSYIGDLIYALGGGAGASSDYYASNSGPEKVKCANGGGAATSAVNTKPWAGGNAGAAAFGAGGYSGRGAGGGGGCGGVGQTGTGTIELYVGGTGGAGEDISAWLGQAAGTTIKGAGGGGSGRGTGTGYRGAGGSSGIGGYGGANSENGGSAGANTASGGGGGGWQPTAGTTRSGGAGGSGIIYVRFRDNA